MPNQPLSTQSMRIWVDRHGRPCDSERHDARPLQVVPCDDDAVERVARLLFARSFIPIQTVERVAPLWDDMDDDRREFLRDAAREVLMTAGGE